MGAAIATCRFANKAIAYPKTEGGPPGRLHLCAELPLACIEGNDAGASKRLERVT